MANENVLVVEDDMLIGIDLARTISKGGFEPHGPFGTEQEADAFLAQNSVDVALLDVNLGTGETSLALAGRLRDAGTPFAFLTGYASQPSQFGDEFGDVRRLSKPCRPETVVLAIRDLLDGR